MESKTPGIVLKKQNFGEADRILRIFTSELGVISAIAKGVKKITSKKGGCLELFCESNLRLYRRKGDLFLITDAATKKNFDSKDLEVLKTAYAASELLLNISPPEKELPKIYKIFSDFLALLPTTKKLQLLKIAFFAKTLNIFGFLEDSANMPERERKFFKFILNSDFTEILKLAADPEIFRAAENKLAEILENVSEKISKVSAATHDWS
jgi:DNA repair protein RecO (recombination protein O)